MSLNGPDASGGSRSVLVRFLIVGGLSSLSYSLIFALVLQVTDAPVFIASVVLFCLFILITYQTHKHFTFGAQALRKAAFLSYAALQLTCFSAVSWVSAHLVTGVYFLDAALYLVTIGLAAMLSFLVGRFHIFRPMSEDGQ